MKIPYPLTVCLLVLMVCSRKTLAQEGISSLNHQIQLQEKDAFFSVSVAGPREALLFVGERKQASAYLVDSSLSTAKRITGLKDVPYLNDAPNYLGGICESSGHYCLYFGNNALSKMRTYQIDFDRQKGRYTELASLEDPRHLITSFSDSNKLFIVTNNRSKNYLTVYISEDGHPFTSKTFDMNPYPSQHFKYMDQLFHCKYGRTDESFVDPTSINGPLNVCQIFKFYHHGDKIYLTGDYYGTTVWTLDLKTEKVQFHEFSEPHGLGKYDNSFIDFQSGRIFVTSYVRLGMEITAFDFTSGDFIKKMDILPQNVFQIKNGPLLLAGKLFDRKALEDIDSAKTLRKGIEHYGFYPLVCVNRYPGYKDTLGITFGWWNKLNGPIIIPGIGFISSTMAAVQLISAGILTGINGWTNSTTTFGQVFIDSKTLNVVHVPTKHLPQERVLRLKHDKGLYNEEEFFFHAGDTYVYGFFDQRSKHLQFFKL